MTSNIKLYLVFTVKSISWESEAFAVAFVVVAQTGEILQTQSLAYLPDLSTVEPTTRQWIEQQILPHLPPAPELKSNALELRQAFWHWWQYWSNKGATLVTDRFGSESVIFLAACVLDQPQTRLSQMPVVIYDVTTALLVARMATPLERLESELPEHHPICDAAFAARMFIELAVKPNSLEG